MAQPSYYPLSPLKSPLEHTTSPSFRDVDPPQLAVTSGADGLPKPRSGKPLHPQLFRKGDRSPSWHVVSTRLEMALLPLVAIGYLAFCYSVHGRAVPVTTFGLYDVTPQHLATIKGGITSISIILISIALYPVYDVVSQLKSEEFFRVLASRTHGVPLETINHISIPTFGSTDMMMATWRQTCSNYYILGIVASLLIWIVATLAPGTLTINSVLADGELMAFAIGAVTAQSVLNGSDLLEPASHASVNSAPAASIAWAEIELGVQYSFGMANSSNPDYAAYIAPIPLDLPTTTSARWLTDVIGLNPTCSWASTNLTTPIQLPFNSTSDFNQYIATAHLLDFNLDVQVTNTDMPQSGGTAFATIKNPTYTGVVTNHTTNAPASDGSTVFLLGQCQSGCLPAVYADITLDLTGINTTFTIALTDQTWSMAILTCTPNITIETREVRNDGHGVLTVQPLPAGTQLTRQRNLNPIQTTALFSILTISLSQNVGSLSGTEASSSLGSQVQGGMLFGKAQFEGLPGTDAPFGTSATISPASTKNITQGYTRVLLSATKSYLAGYLGTAYVPGRLSKSEFVFAASTPNLAVSTAVFALLIALIILAHFRSGKGTEFTLVNIAAAMHGSELPAQFAHIMAGQAADVHAHAHVEADENPEADSALGEGKVYHGGADSPDPQQDIIRMMGERRVFMQRRENGTQILHMS